MSRAFQKHGLRLNIEVSYGRVGRDPKHPCLSVSAWIQALDRAGKLDELAGCSGDYSAQLQTFWTRFQQAHPSHQFFETSTPWAQALPVLLHGDEGTTYKKDGALVISLQSPMGKGTAKNKLGNLGDDGDGQQLLNFVGHAFETRFLIIAALKDTLHVVYKHKVKAFVNRDKGKLSFVYETI